MLAKFVQANADLGDRFLVVGVHEYGPTNVEEIRAEVEKSTEERKAEIREIESKGFRVSAEFGLVPVIVIDDASGGARARFGAESLGDMVLLDPRGVVAATGEASFEKLQSVASALRGRVSDAKVKLDGSATVSQVESALRDLDALGLNAADKVADEFAVACPPKFLLAVLEATARLGRAAAVVAVLSDVDAKRRKAAIDATAKAPSPAWVAPLLAITARAKVPADEACAALRAAVASGPGDASVLARVTELARKSDQAIRTCAIDLLGRFSFPEAKAELLTFLVNDPWRGARLAAALALAQVGGDDVVKALERAASDDKVDTVRAAATKALSIVAKKAAPKGG